MKKIEQLLEWGGIKRDIIFLVISGIALASSLFRGDTLSLNPAWIAIVLCGVPIMLEAVIGLVTAFDIKADVLVSLALIASVIIGEIFAAGEITFIMQLGALLEDLTVARARAGIESLVKLTPRTARLITEDGEKIVAAEEVKAGDILRLFPGETIPVDGVITEGQSSVDEAVMTGESMPVDKAAGDEVLSGTINRFGSFDMRAVKVGEDSSLARMIKLVKSANAGKAKIVRLADRWATWIVVIALTAALLTFLVTGEAIRSVTILVVFCPCALVLATPTAVMAAIGNAAKHGFLVKEGVALERLAEVDCAAFDKTGTLTEGEPKVCEVRSFDSEISNELLYTYIAGVEVRSEHPLGKAIVKSYRGDKKALPEAEDFRLIQGRGVEAIVSGKKIIAGNLKLLSERGITVSPEILAAGEEFSEKGDTVIYAAVEGKAAGFTALEDSLREKAAETVSRLKACKVKPVLLTGDNKNAALSIGEKAGIEEIHYGCLPEDKLKIIEGLYKEGKKACMIGDGINDAPALKKAHTGIAMGAAGSDIAVDAADIALINDDIKELPHLIRLSKRMAVTIKCNLTFSMTLNFIAIILAAAGLLNPVIGALVHNCGSVLVIINSALLLKWRYKNDINY